LKTCFRRFSALILCLATLFSRCVVAYADETQAKDLRDGITIRGSGYDSFRFLTDGDLKRYVKSSGSCTLKLESPEANIASFDQAAPLASQEREALFRLAETMKEAVPCTACRYCTAHCPMELNIPMLLAAYNEFKFNPGFMASMKLDALPENKRPAACIGCGACAKMCPQLIEIPQILHTFAERLAQLPTWAQICRQRDEAARKLREARQG